MKNLLFAKREAERQDTVAKIFAALCKKAGLPKPVPEFRFHPVRKWRIDYAFPEYKIGLEVDGGIWTKGRHVRGSGWLKDSEKLNELAASGWRMFRCTPDSLFETTTVELLKRALLAPNPVQVKQT